MNTPEESKNHGKQLNKEQRTSQIKHNAKKYEDEPNDQGCFGAIKNIFSSGIKKDTNDHQSQKKEKEDQEKKINTGTKPEEKKNEKSRRQKISSTVSKGYSNFKKALGIETGNKKVETPKK